MDYFFLERLAYSLCSADCVKRVTGSNFLGWLSGYLFDVNLSKYSELNSKSVKGQKLKENGTIVKINSCRCPLPLTDPVTSGQCLCLGVLMLIKPVF